jgi:ketosteroid isomerase-like protein
MMKTAFLLFFLTAFVVTSAQSSAEKKIIAVLKAQDECWNRGDMEGFMQTYWQNDSLMFIGKSGVTYGWQQTLDNYKRGYPDTVAMGKLNFTLIQMCKINRKHCFVVGKWHLKRSMGDLQGHFTLMLRKIKKRWVIVADHSS